MTAAEASSFPPNERIETVTFDDGARTLGVLLRGSDEARAVPAASVAALYGARIRHDSITGGSAGGGISYVKIAATVVTGIPMGITKGGPKQKAVAGTEFHHALALRVAGIPQVWYLLAASFNFRKALGAEATYSGDINLKLFVKRLTAFAPQAAHDSYFAAAVANADLPPPLDSLLEFLRAASA